MRHYKHIASGEEKGVVRKLGVARLRCGELNKLSAGNKVKHSGSNLSRSDNAHAPPPGQVWLGSVENLYEPSLQTIPKQIAADIINNVGQEDSFIHREYCD